MCQGEAVCRKPLNSSQKKVTVKQRLGLHEQHTHISDPIKSIQILWNPPNLTITSKIPCSQLPELPEIMQVCEAHCCPGSHQNAPQALQTPSAHLIAVGRSNKNLPNVQLVKAEVELRPYTFPFDAQGQPGLSTWGEISISVQ